MAKGAFGLPGIQVRGRLGGMVFVPQPGGRMTVRRAPARVPPPTERQAAGTARFRPVAEAWNLLSIEEARAWRRYGQGLGAKPDGRAVQANNAFTALGAKCLQMRPGEGVPRLPPTEGFLGDGIRVFVSTPSPTVPPSARASLQGEPSLTFAANGPNAEGIVTEMLTQRLKSRLRTPVGDRYRSQGFVAFAAGALKASVPCERGAWAVAVRFVRWDTGQETAVVPLGVIEV